MAFSHYGGTLLDAGDGSSLLGLVAERGPFDLIICNQSLPSIAGTQVLTMIRTAGDQTPFVLVAPFCRKSIKNNLRKLGNAAVIEDPLDATELHRVAKELVNACNLAA
jgi:CheY-like chemotaxis protein